MENINLEADVWYSNRDLIFAITHALGKKSYWPIDYLAEEFDYVTFHQEKLQSTQDEWSLVSELGSIRIYDNLYGPRIILLLANLTPGQPYKFNKITKERASREKDESRRRRLEGDTFKARIDHLKTALDKAREFVPETTQRIVLWSWDTSMSKPGGVLYDIFGKFSKDVGIPTEIHLHENYHLTPTKDFGENSHSESGNRHLGELTYAPKKRRPSKIIAPENGTSRQLFNKKLEEECRDGDKENVNPAAQETPKKPLIDIPSKHGIRRRLFNEDPASDGTEVKKEIKKKEGDEEDEGISDAETVVFEDVRDLFKSDLGDLPLLDEVFPPGEELFSNEESTLTALLPMKDPSAGKSGKVPRKPTQAKRRGRCQESEYKKPLKKSKECQNTSSHRGENGGGSSTAPEQDINPDNSDHLTCSQPFNIYDYNSQIF